MAVAADFTNTGTDHTQLDAPSLSRCQRGGKISYGSINATGSGGTAARLRPVGILQRLGSTLRALPHTAPPVLLSGVLNLMLSVPFGSAYFPVSFSQENIGYGGMISGTWSDAGMRMFLFSTAVCQLVFSFFSSFECSVGMQMVENIPFIRSLAEICVQHATGEGDLADQVLPTLFFLLAASSVAVGVAFHALAALGLGNVVYFFPRHVLLGCIAGIGIFVAQTGVQVSTHDGSFDLSDPSSCLRVLFDSRTAGLLGVALTLELLLRSIHGLKSLGDHPLIDPGFFVAITPAFYVALKIFGISRQKAVDAGFFFPQPDDSAGVTSTVWTAAADPWSPLIRAASDGINWAAVSAALPTVGGLVIFSLMHVPINIPALAVTVGVEPDINREFRAHGFSNIIVGFLGGIQNYLCYANSVLYVKSGGGGRLMSIAVCGLTVVLFVYGPELTPYIPRCMAGTLLLHVGIDLFMEGVYDSYGQFDTLEYSGIWLIAVVMVLQGMSAGLLVGLASALFTYVYQSGVYVDPLRGSMTAATLRSHRWRHPEAEAVLDSKVYGRRRILVLQLQGNLFFGNIQMLTDKVKKILQEKSSSVEDDFPEKSIWVVVVDFTLVTGIDSSAAQTVSKLKGLMKEQYGIYLTVYVTGRADGFPCVYNLTADLVKPGGDNSDHDNGVDGFNQLHIGQVQGSSKNLPCPPAVATVPGVPHFLDDHLKLEELERPSFSLGRRRISMALPVLQGDQVFDDLNEALSYCEDYLISRKSPGLESKNTDLIEEEKIRREACNALDLLKNLLPQSDPTSRRRLLTYFEEEICSRGDCLWRQGSTSDSLKLVIAGKLKSILEDEAGTTEDVYPGTMIGELGLVHGMSRLSTVICTEDCILYSLSRAKWLILTEKHPALARIIDMIVIRYLAHRVQHVSNRIFETRCVPI